MTIRMLQMAFVFGGVLLLSAGCEATDPYVYTSDEFDRQAPGFNIVPVDRYAAVVCYSNLISSDEDVAAVAGESCGHFGKEAHRSSTSVGDCPIAVPLEAHFDCVTP